MTTSEQPPPEGSEQPPQDASGEGLDDNTETATGGGGQSEAKDD